MRFDRAEFAGTVADLGVFVPIAVALIVSNGLSATAVLLPAALLYIAAGLIYRLPIPVQPLKAFGAIAIAQGLGSNEIAAGALLMGAIFLVLGVSGLLNRVAAFFPKPIIRGVQLSVGLLFLSLAWKLTMTPPAAFADHGQPTWLLAGGGIAVVLAAFLLPRQFVAFALMAITVAAIAFSFHGTLALGPAEMPLPELSAGAFAAAAVALVLPQLPLTFANSCLATADAAKTYFGREGERVTPGRLAMSLGTANLFAGAIGGMPVCHGAGGLTAHYSFGARSGGTPIILGIVLLILAIGFGASLAALLASFPLAVLAGLLALAGILHVALLKDLAHPAHWALAIGVGVAGFIGNLALALVAGLLIWWGAEVILGRQSADRGRD